MQKIIKFLIILLFSFIELHAQIGWFARSSGGLSEKFYAVHFINENAGLVVGENGVILKTIDGGDSWTRKATGLTNETLRGVQLFNSGFGYIVGGSTTNPAEAPIILKTYDYGDNWTEQTNHPTDRNLYAVFFLNEALGWACGRAATIIQTSTGGNPWIWSKQPDPASYFLDIYFTDASNGWAVGYAGWIYHTINGGISWGPQTFPYTPKSKLESVYFVDASTGWIVGERGDIVKTTNGGGTWIAQNSGTSNWLYSVHFFNQNVGWTVGRYATIKYTTDGGTTWVSQDSSHAGTNTLASVFFIDHKIGWAVGQNGIILKTWTGGTLSNVDDNNNNLIRDYKLFQNHPNPFNPSTTISYKLPEADFVSILIYDVSGKEISKLVNEYKRSGTHEIKWDGTNFPSGIYYYQLITNDFVDTKKFILLK
jgi:photosystem II stability/assembly factor-like uncharacterized protein